MADADPDVLGALNRAAERYTTFADLAGNLVREASALDSTAGRTAHLDALRAAISFIRRPDGTFVTHYAAAAGRLQPRTPHQADAGILEVWAAYADVSEDDFVRAHLHHLLADARADRPHEHARAAITAYRAAVPELLAANTDAARLRATQALAGATNLAMRMNQKDLYASLVTDVTGAIGQLLAVARPPFGLIHELLEALLDVLRVSKAGPAVGVALIERAVTASSGNLIMHQAFFELLRHAAGDEESRKAVARRGVSATMADAESTPTGMHRLLLLNDAATRAEQAGLTDLAEQARTRMQSMTVGDLGLTATAIPLQLTPAEREAALAQVEQAATLADAIWRIAAMPSPADTDARAEQFARLLMVGSPFSSGIPRGRINPAGPVPSAPASPDALDNTKTRYRNFALQRSALVYELQLDRVWERFAPSAEQLVALFDCSELVTLSRTQMLARALAFYANGQDHDAAVHMALPRVESLIRELERGRGVPVLSVAKGPTLGGVAQLGTLISNLGKIGMDEDRRQAFALTFTDGEHGLNLRNNLSHGLIDCPPRAAVALVLQAALYLLAIAHGVITLAPPSAAATPQPV